MQKIRVGVLMGGKSIEREVSFNSGRTICDHLDTNKYKIIPLFQAYTGKIYILPWRFLHRGTTLDFINRLEMEAEKISWDNLKNIIDFMYIAVHGRYAEDGTLQGFLEVLQIPYLGSKIFGSSVGMDKIIQKQFLKYNNISSPAGITILPKEIINFAIYKNKILEKIKAKNIRGPYIIKPVGEGSSLGISVIEDLSRLDELEAALKAACFADNNFTQKVLLEEKIEGLEFTCIILTDYKNNKPIVLPITEIVPESNSQFFDYTQKYMPGRAIKYTPARCSQEITEKIEQVCLNTMKALDMTNLCRIDGIVDSNKEIFIIDPNTLSGMGPSSFLFRQSAKLFSHARLINHLIETELEKSKLSVKDHNPEYKLYDIKKMRVIVLMGGRSNEKEISLESGRNVCYKLSNFKYEIIPVFVDSKLELFRLSEDLLILNSTNEIEREINKRRNIEKLYWADLPNLSDFVFIALHGGEGENGAIQGTLEMLELPYNGSSILASSICIDKHRTANLLRANHFHTPKELLIEKTDWLNNKEKIIDKIYTLTEGPIIIKPHNDGCSVLVSKVNSLEELETELDRNFESKDILLIQEYIKGIELTVGVFGNYENITVMPASQVIAQKEILSIEEKFLPGAGENRTPAELPQEVIFLINKTIADVYKTVGCTGYARIDCFYKPDSKQLVILEINSLPALTPATCLFHQAAEIDLMPSDFLDKIILLGIELYNNNRLLLVKDNL